MFLGFFCSWFVPETELGPITNLNMPGFDRMLQDVAGCDRMLRCRVKANHFWKTPQGF